MPDLLSKFVDYDYILLTSTQEGLPITIIEASQTALIPIASNVGDTINAASGYGFFFESNIFPDLVEKFKKAKLILDKDCDKNNYSEYYQISKNIYEESNSRWKLNQYLRIFMS